MSDAGPRRLPGTAELLILAVALASIIGIARTPVPGSDDREKPPQMNIEKTDAGISVAGQVSSAANAAILRNSLDQPGVVASFDLQEGQLMPPGWALVTELALRAALHTQRSETSIDIDGIVIRGVTAETDSWRNALAKLEAAMLPGMRLDSNVIELSSFADLEELCRRQFAAIQKNRSLEFATGSSSIEANGHALLDRLLETAADCPTAVITIRAAGDGPASLAASRWLADARAKSIADYMTSHGLNPSRLTVMPPSDDDHTRARQARFAVSFIAPSADEQPTGAASSRQPLAIPEKQAD